MSDISSVQRLENILITVDNCSDYVPGWSAVTNLVDIFEKGVGEWACGTEALKEHEYCKHIHDKPYWRCALLLLPIIGNVIIAIYDYYQMRHQEKMKRLGEDMDAGFLGIGTLPNDPAERAFALQYGSDAFEARNLGIVGPLPEGSAHRRLILDETRTEIMAAAKANFIQSLDAQVQAFQNTINDFKERIQHPENPIGIEIQGGLFGTGKLLQTLGVYPQEFNKTPFENLNFYWLTIRQQFSFTALGLGLGDLGLKDDPDVAQRKQQIETHQATLIQLRRTSYENLVGQLNREAFLKEMKAQYLDSFTKEKPTDDSVNAMKYFELLAAIKERLTQIEEPYRKIELEVFAALDLP